MKGALSAKALVWTVIVVVALVFVGWWAYDAYMAPKALAPENSQISPGNLTP